jgi:hypothetical protein
MGILKIIEDFSGKEFHTYLYKYSLFLSTLLLVVGYTGIIFVSPKYRNELEIFITYYTCLILIIRFNPYSGIKTFTRSDTSFAFHAGILLLLNGVSSNIIQQYI